MKIKLSQLKRIIKEEVRRSLRENVDADMITIEVDIAFESGEYSDPDSPERVFTKGQDVTELAPEYSGITPDKLIIVEPYGPGGGNPVCHASFYEESRARQWLAGLTDDDDDAFFDSFVVNEAPI
jgi:hypothetical protein